MNIVLQLKIRHTLPKKVWLTILTTLKLESEPLADKISDIYLPYNIIILFER